jgi:HAD superfamily phosphoserine phosphatase-like hydrolase
MSRRRGVAAFDLDGTLLRGRTVCEILAEPLGHVAEMRHFETLSTEHDIMMARIEMARWYRDTTIVDLINDLQKAEWAPGAHEAVLALQSEGIEVAVVSITWSFAVHWFAEQLKVSRHLGTELFPNGDIGHVWARDKAQFVRHLSFVAGVPPRRVAAVGDSPGDIDMLHEAALRFYVGRTPPGELTQLIHLPAADLRVVADRILHEWAD